MFERRDDEVESRPPPAGRPSQSGRATRGPAASLAGLSAPFPLTVGQVPCGGHVSKFHPDGVQLSALGQREPRSSVPGVQLERLEQPKASRPQMEAKEPAVTFSLFWHFEGFPCSAL